MVGAWAGEFGQTQFLASSYVKFAVDFDGNGRRDLIRSKADALASTANYLKAYGWKKGQAYQPGSANYAVLGQMEQGEGVPADDRCAGSKGRRLTAARRGRGGEPGRSR